MGFLQRAALNVAVVLPLLAAAAGVCYVVVERHIKIEPAKAAQPASTISMRRVGQVTAAEAEPLQPPTELAEAMFKRALALRDANAGPVPPLISSVPIPKPRPKKLGSL